MNGDDDVLQTKNWHKHTVNNIMVHFIYGNGQQFGQYNLHHNVCTKLCERLYFSLSIPLLSISLYLSKEKTTKNGANLNEATFICFLSTISIRAVCVMHHKNLVLSFPRLSFLIPHPSPSLSPSSLLHLHLHTLHFNLISKHDRRAKQHTFESRRWHRCKLLTTM